jgi:hypothetical protein
VGLLEAPSIAFIVSSSAFNRFQISTAYGIPEFFLYVASGVFATISALPPSSPFSIGRTAGPFNGNADGGYTGVESCQYPSTEMS